MAMDTARVRFTVPKTVKDKRKAQAASRGLILSAFLRHVVDDQIVWDAAPSEAQWRLSAAASR